jgi:transposase
MALQEDTLGQSIFMNSADMVPKDHISKLVAAIVDEIDVSKAEEKFIGTPGYPAYPRRMLLRLMVMSAVDGIFSSRKISKLARENVIYIHLTGNKQPDFRTICLFRNSNENLIEDVFRKVVLVARGLKMMNLGHLTVDGTKIKANAANSHSLSKEDIELIREIIRKGIEIDKKEDEIYGDKRGDELPPDLDTMKKIKDKIHEIEEKKGGKLKQAGKRLVRKHVLGNEKEKRKVEGLLERASQEIMQSGQKATSLTDPDARFMLNKKKRKEFCYNPQITVDIDSSLIVSNDVCQDVCDYWQLVPQVEQTEEVVGKLPKGTKFSADNGYFKGTNLHYMERRGFDLYMADERRAAEENGNLQTIGPYYREKFYYDEGNDCFICPMGEVLTKRGIYLQKSRAEHFYRCSDCAGCPVKAQCTNSKNRSITTRGFEGERRRMWEKIETKEGTQFYNLRKKVEPIFGDIKQNLGKREFVMRGLKGVKTEFNLACIAHNLRLMWNKMERELDLHRMVKGPSTSQTLMLDGIGSLAKAASDFWSRRLVLLGVKVGC